MIDTQSLVCPYIDKDIAQVSGTQYFCTFDKMEFESMEAHCKYCEMYRFLKKRGLEQLNNA